jgi:hypothetical protein
MKQNLSVKWPQELDAKIQPIFKNSLYRNREDGKLIPQLGGITEFHPKDQFYILVPSGYLAV